MREAMRGYLNAASGLTELTRKRAQDLALSLLSSSGAGSGGAAVAHQVSALAEELVSAAKSNRAAVQEMIRGEVEIAVAHLGLVPAAELAGARQQIAALESAVAELKRGQQSVPPTAVTPFTPAKTRPSRSAMKRAAQSAAPAPAKQAIAKKATAKKATAKKATAKKATAKKATAKKATAKKATAKKATAKKAAAKRAPS